MRARSHGARRGPQRGGGEFAPRVRKLIFQPPAHARDASIRKNPMNDECTL
jgi:hypothetical protein